MFVENEVTDHGRGKAKAISQVLVYFQFLSKQKSNAKIHEQANKAHHRKLQEF